MKQRQVSSVVDGVEVRAIAGVPRPAERVVVVSHGLGLDVILGALGRRGFSAELAARGFSP